MNIMKHKYAFVALAAFALAALPVFASWTYDSSGKTLTQGSVVLQNVTASGTKLTIGDNKTNTTATDLDFSTGVEGGYTVTQIAQDAFNGSDPSYGAIYYFNPITATSKWIWSRPLIVNIGKHRFCS